MKKLYFLFLLLWPVVFFAQIVDIPDANFKFALTSTNCVLSDEDGTPIGDVDTNDDGEIQVSEALAVNSLDVSNRDIESLAGIEAFSHLYYLNCSHNALTSLLINANYDWLKLDCSYNQLTSLSGNIISTEFETTIDCSHNLLTNFDITGNYFEYIICAHNLLTDFTPSISYIGELDLSDNLFTSFTSSSYADYLTLNDCPLMTTCHVQWVGVSASISNNPQLVFATLAPDGEFYVSNNPLLQSVNIKDGYAAFIDGDFPDPLFNLHNNPSLQFVCVDDLGNWYNEGDWFFQDERATVLVDPNVSVTYYCDLLPGGNYGTLTGNIHYDCGGIDATVSASQAVLNLTSGTANVASIAPDAGHFTYYGIGNGTLTPVMPNDYWTVSPPSSTYALANGSSQTIDFCLTANGTHPDLDVAIIPVVPPRPGFDAVYKLTYRNVGTETASGTVGFDFDDIVVDAVSSSPSADSQATGHLTWNFSLLAPFETREITITLNVNSPVETPSVQIGDILTFHADVSAGTDETPANNEFDLNQTVVGSIDPNDKAVSNAVVSSTGLDRDLYYTIRFQNTGTYPAENVVVRDLLSDKLDLSSIAFVEASHPCRMQLTGKTAFMEADKLEFFFENIGLADAADNEPASHGFVTFRIKPKSTDILGDVIPNSAGIYFDYNAPVATNTVTTTVTQLGTTNFAADDFSVFPNPASGMVTVKLADAANITSVAVYNTLGQKILSVKPAFENGVVTIDPGALTSGTYLLQVISNRGTSTKKLVRL